MDVNLSPARQAFYHAGCALRHTSKAIAALWAMPSVRMGAWLAAAILYIWLFAGCATVKRAIMGDPVQRLEREEKRNAETTDTLAKQGQEFAAAAEKAIARDPAPSLNSKAALYLLRRGNKAFDLAYGPILPARDAQLEKMVADLTSENAQLREAGERQLAAMDRQTNDAAAKLMASDAKIAELTGKVTQYASERDEVARKWERMMRWIYVAAGSWVFVAFVLPILSTAFPAIGGVTKVAQTILSPIASATATKAQRVLTDVVSGVEAIRSKLKQAGTITRAEADLILREYVTEADGTAAAVDASRRDQQLV